MRLGIALILALEIVSVSSPAAPASELSNRAQDIIDAKNANLSGNVNTPPEGAVGGDVISNATPIPALPFSDAGNTCAFTNDYDEVCPYTGSLSPDVVYSYTPQSNQAVTFDICNSGYDTKIYIYENAVGNLIDCSDDDCNDPAGNPFRSILSCVPVIAGNVYYVVVDGYSGDCGSYNLSVYEEGDCPEVCDPEACPPTAMLEGEPVCFNEYTDTFNGGCFSQPALFSTLPCIDGISVCGTSGVYGLNGDIARDTDWYQIDVGPTPCELTAHVCATFYVQLAVLDGDAGCDPVLIECGSVFGEARTVVSCGPTIVSGTVWIFASAGSFWLDPPACGSRYTLWLDLTCCSPNAVESRSWGAIKGLFR